MWVNQCTTDLGSTLSARVGRNGKLGGGKGRFSGKLKAKCVPSSGHPQFSVDLCLSQFMWRCGRVKDTALGIVIVLGALASSPSCQCELGNFISYVRKTGKCDLLHILMVCQ